jgi:hypothetical protein
MRVFAFEAFDEVGQLRRDAAGLTTVLARLGSECLEASAAIPCGPVQQRVYRNGVTFGIRDLVLAGSDLPRAAREFAARHGSSTRGGIKP